MRPSLSVETALKELGENLKTARLRRRLPQNQVAERAGISLNTLSKIESGNPGVAIGNVAAAIQAIGLDVALLSKIASPDNDLGGISMEKERLPRRARSPKQLF